MIANRSRLTCAAAVAAALFFGASAWAVTSNTGQGIGQVGGFSPEICQPLVVTISSAYTAGNEVGGLVTFPNAVHSNILTAVLESVRLTSKSVQTAEFDITPFTAQPVASTWTDKSAPSITGADILLAMPPIKLTNNFSGLGTHTTYGQDAIGRVITLAASSFYAIVTTPGTPTFASTSDLQLCVGILQD
jgi:hypothetical protein